MVDGDGWKNHAISGGIVRLNPKVDRFYLFSFLKHPIFRQELYSLVPRGATIAHANTLWLGCKRCLSPTKRTRAGSSVTSPRSWRQSLERSGRSEIETRRSCTRSTGNWQRASRKLPSPTSTRLSEKSGTELALMLLYTATNISQRFGSLLIILVDTELQQPPASLSNQAQVWKSRILRTQNRF